MQSRRDQIEPSTQSTPRPKLIEILKLLPKTNCKVCGEPTCMVFAARSPDGEMFGKARIKSIVQQNARRSAADILQEIVASLTAFQQSSIPADDVTLVVVKFTE